MMQIEVIAFYVALATIDIAILLAICFSHKKESLERIRKLKDRWLDNLPLKFAEIGEKIQKNNLTPYETRKNLNEIISNYDVIEKINKAYTGKKISDNVLKLLGFNLLLISFSAIIALANAFSTDDNISVMLVGISLVIIVYFFMFLAQVIIFVITEEDKFQKLEK